MAWKRKLYNLFADLGDWLGKKSKDKGHAIILAVLCIVSPLIWYLLLALLLHRTEKVKENDGNLNLSFENLQTIL